MAKCHTEKLHKAKGLCASCYNTALDKRLRTSDPEWRQRLLKRKREAYKKIVEKNPLTAYNKNLRFVLKRHNITEAEYESMVSSQGNKCKICGNTNNEKRIRRLCVDHNHDTNKIRGLLCNSCNRGIGLFRDNPNILRIAAKYIEDDLSATSGKEFNSVEKAKK